MQTLRQELTRKETELTRNKAELTRKEVDLAETRQQLIQRETELTRKEAEVVRAEDSIRREQQQIQEMRQRETELVQAKDREMPLLQQQLGEKEQQIQEMRQRETELVPAKDREMPLLQQQLGEKEQQIQEMRQRETELVPAKDREMPLLQRQLGEKHSYTCQVSGPGLTSATVNQPTHVLVQLTDSSGRPYSLPLNVTAQLELFSKATPTNAPESTPTSPPETTSRWPWSRKPPSQYEVLYTPVSRGQQKLHVQVNDREINGSPFTVTVYPDPRQLGHPVRTVTGLVSPYDVAFNSHQEMIVSGYWGHRLSIFDIRGHKIRTLGSRGDSPDQMESPAGIATDDADNIYVSSWHKLQKFTSSGELIKCIGQRGSK
ncbi:Protein lin-41, partial [Geodia barretti]